ncbi:MAG: magnesium-translocating P-type ATPase [Candidatus Micrarchaeota archaeon]|nr:magnesium-translocating P-type ATPase [Candidatus Micrarchaeota archaeon]
MLSREELKKAHLWAIPIENAYEQLTTSITGISEHEAVRRQRTIGLNELAPKKKRSAVLLFLSYFINPLILLLLAVASVSFFLGNTLSAEIIGVMVLISVSLTFHQEYTARDAAEKLRKMIRNTATVVRDSNVREIPLKFLVPGDIIRLSSGDLVPADCRIISCKDFFVNQASLTGESLPVEKTTQPSKPDASPQEMTNAVFFGSSVVSGSAEALVIRTGMDTQFGELARRLQSSAPETAFEKGIREFSDMMVKLVIVLVVAIFLINFFTKNDLIAAMLFALAVSVGLTPEMLPVIVTANLAQGARNMAKKEVIVKRLPSIQNLGAMDVLCTDKTGTLTEDKIELVRHVNVDFQEDERVLRLAYLNSYYQTGLKNPLDGAVLAHDEELGKKGLAGTSKIDEIPFDFVRRRMSVVVKDGRTHLMITKGSPESIIPICRRFHCGEREGKFGKKEAEKARKLYNLLSSDGFRVLALATRRAHAEKSTYRISDESDMTFEGFLAFLDPPKKTAKKSIQELMARGIEIKILSGDNELVNQKIARVVGLEVKGTITGDEIDKASDESLQVLVEKNTIFARVSPVQKERIILALQRNKHVVGYLGDGINDALALKTADVGISVNSAVDVAKEAADIILLRKSLHVTYDGVDEGRRTFTNTVKYLRMGASSNFGNMFSVVGASIFLPFLPMSPLQIILNNFLYDISQLGITTDTVDKEVLSKPTKWNIDGIRNFVIFVGPISSIFDYLTYGVMWFVFGATTIAKQGIFHAGWFIESLMTQTLVVHVIRTNKIPFLQSMPSKRLTILTFGIVAVGLAIVATPLREMFDFGELPAEYYPILFGLVISYLALTQLAKSLLLKMKIIS